MCPEAVNLNVRLDQKADATRYKCWVPSWTMPQQQVAIRDGYYQSLHFIQTLPTRRNPSGYFFGLSGKLNLAAWLRGLRAGQQRMHSPETIVFLSLPEKISCLLLRFSDALLV